MEVLLRAVRNIPIIGEVAKYFYARYLIKDMVNIKRSGTLPPELTAFTGQELEKKIENKAGLLWTEELEPALKQERIPSYVITSIEGKAKKDMAEALLARAKEQNQERNQN